MPTKLITLTKNQVAIVDSADYDELSRHRWCAHKVGKKTYAARGDRGRLVHMHRVILGAPAGAEVDHIDGCGLNNSRENLRLATKSQNGSNRSKNKNNSSGFKGVTWHRKNKTWIAQIKVNGKRKHLGCFLNIYEAAAAYDAAARALHGEFAKTNLALVAQ